MLIIGISGACRREELTFLDVKNITDKGSYIIIQIPDTKTNVRREFTISPGNFEGLDLLEIFRTDHHRLKLLDFFLVFGTENAQGRQ
jgi:integrase